MNWKFKYAGLGMAIGGMAVTLFQGYSGNISETIASATWTILGAKMFFNLEDKHKKSDEK